jgi:uncharacterized membrane protein
MRYVMWLVLLAGCGGVGTTAQCSDGGTTLTWASFGQAFVSSYCVSCHGGDRAERGIDLSTEAGVTRYASDVLAVAGESSTMPPFGESSPTAAERAQLVEWLSCGVP